MCVLSIAGDPTPFPAVRVAHPGVDAASIPLWRQLYLDLTQSIQYDGMHTFSGNAKDVFLLMCGQLPRPESGVPVYDAQCNHRWQNGETPWKVGERV